MSAVRRALGVALVALVLSTACGDGSPAITEQARDDLGGRMDAIGLAIAAGESQQASAALDELVSQAERYAEDGQIETNRLASILSAAEDLREQLGEASTTATTSTTAPPLAPFQDTGEGDEGDEEGDEGDGNEGEGNGFGNSGGRGNGDEGDGDD